MELEALRRKIVQFGLFEVDLQQRVLKKSGLRIRLQDQPFQVLALLLERPGDVVTREEIQQKLWPADTYVAFDDGLNTAIKKLRAALSDASDNPRFIETVPRRGYRFVAPIVIPDPPSATGTGTKASSESILIAARERSRVVIETAPRTRTVTKFFVGTAAALILATAGYLFQLRHRSAQSAGDRTSPATASPIRMRPSVAVMGFRNLSQRSDATWLSIALSEMLNTELAAGERLRMIPGERVSHGKANLGLEDSEALAKETLGRIRSELGADYVVLGSYTAVGAQGQRRVRLDLRLQDTNAGETVAEESVSGKEEDLFEIVSDAGTRLRMRFDVAALNHEEASRVRASLPSNVEAARLYAEGLTKLRSFEAREARDLLTKAVAADRNNAMIHSALAAAWSRLGYDAKAKEEAKRALDLSGSLSREDHLMVEGRYHQAAREWPAAIESFRTLWNFFPDNLEYGLLLASVQISAGQGKEALATVEGMRKVPHKGASDPRIDLTEDAAAEVLGDFRHTQTAAEAAAKAGESQHSKLIVAMARSDEGWAWDRLGEFDKALDSLRIAETSFAAAGDRLSAAMSKAMIGEILQARGDSEEARKDYNQTIATCREIGNLKCMGRTTNALGGLLRDQGDLSGARKCFEQVLSINRETGYPPGIAAALGNLANLLDDLGDIRQESKMQQQALDIFTEIGDKRGIGSTMTNLANSLAYQGELNRALSLVDQAIAIHREIGFKRGLSFALSSRADILEQEDRLEDARKAQAEALEIRKALGNPTLVEMSLSQSAALSLDEGHPAEAQSSAELALKQIENQKEYDLEASAYALLTRSLVAQGSMPAARQAAEHAMSSASKVAQYTSHMDALMALAGVNAASGNSIEARKELNDVLARASKSGYEGYRLEAQLALSELELKSSRNGQGRQQLSALEREARAKGLNLIARKAAAAR